VDNKIILLIFGMTVVTYIPRVFPLLSLNKIKLHPKIKRWLELVPPAVLAALLFPTILAPQGFISLDLSNKYLIASIPTILIGSLSRSLPAVIFTGMVSMMLLNVFLT